MSEKKRSRRSGDRKALEAVNEILLKADAELKAARASATIVEYAKCVGACDYYVSSALKEIATAQGGWK